MPSYFSPPFGYSHAFPSEFKVNASALIATLIGTSCPTAITWRVVAVIVGTLKSKAGWSFAHVREKISEGLQPPLANKDSARSVVLVLLRAHVIAPLFHILP